MEQDAGETDYAESFHSVRELDLLAAGAPCQPFSLGGKHAGDGDARNMFPQVFEAVRALRPRAIMLENVRGLRRQSFRPYYEYILLQIELPHVPPRDGESWEEHKRRLLAERTVLELHDPSETYQLQDNLLNSADYGTPQRRERVLMVALRRDLGMTWEFPVGEHSEDRLLYEQYITREYWTRHGVSPRPVPDKLAKRVQRLESHPPNGLPWRTLRDAIAGMPEPVNSVPADGWDFHIGIPNARVYAGHTGNDLDKPSKTIKAGDHGNPGGEHVLIKDDGSVRYMTVRECARVQDFPDQYHFAGSRSEAMRQIGNAVPVRLAESVARSIRYTLEAPLAKSDSVCLEQQDPVLVS
jgi:DNA (cytosine-5)-methyltransferase 1